MKTDVRSVRAAAHGWITVNDDDIEKREEKEMKSVKRLRKTDNRLLPFIFSRNRQFMGLPLLLYLIDDKLIIKINRF